MFCESIRPVSVRPFFSLIIYLLKSVIFRKIYFEFIILTCLTFQLFEQSSVCVHSGRSRQADKSGRSFPLRQSTKSRQPKIANQDDSHHQAVDPLDHTDDKFC